MNMLIEKLAIREFWMFTIAGVGLLVTGGVLVAIIAWGVPEGAGEIISATLAAIVLRIGDVINAIRALWRVSQEHVEGDPPPCQPRTDPEMV